MHPNIEDGFALLGLKRARLGFLQQAEMHPTGQHKLSMSCYLNYTCMHTCMYAQEHKCKCTHRDSHTNYVQPAGVVE